MTKTLSRRAALAAIHEISAETGLPAPDVDKLEQTIYRGQKYATGTYMGGCPMWRAGIEPWRTTNPDLSERRKRWADAWDLRFLRYDDVRVSRWR